MSSLVLIKLRAVYCSFAVLLDFFKIASFRYISQKLSAVRSLYSTVTLAL